jgi:hypothetical protein
MTDVEENHCGGVRLLEWLIPNNNADLNSLAGPGSILLFSITTWQNEYKKREIRKRESIANPPPFI